MITKFTIRNFKRLQDVTLDLGSAAVFIGPNNSGKTTALQALALWDIGWRRWAAKRDESTASERQGVTINRRDLFAIPVPSAKLLWADLHTHQSARKDGKPKTDKVYINLTAEGDQGGVAWRCSLDFYYAKEESFYCRLVDAPDGQVPAGARQHRVVFQYCCFRQMRLQYSRQTTGAKPFEAGECGALVCVARRWLECCRRVPALAPDDHGERMGSCGA